MRYTTKDFSKSQIGIWDNREKAFVVNPTSGRKRLFYRLDSAKKVAAQLELAVDRK